MAIGSNAGRGTGYANWDLSRFSSVSPRKCRESTSIRPWPLYLLRGSCWLFAYNLTVKMEAICSYETSANAYRTTRVHIPGDSIRFANRFCCDSKLTQLVSLLGLQARSSSAWAWGGRELLQTRVFPQTPANLSSNLSVPVAKGWIPLLSKNLVPLVTDPSRSSAPTAHRLAAN
jgi:hypothetical protein